MSELKTKISAWLNDKNNNENDLIDFLVEECGIILEENDAYAEDEYEDCGDLDKKCDVDDCDKIIRNFYLGNPFGNGDRNCSECSEEPPIVEDGFRTNNECVCEKKPDNDYPCLCDEADDAYRAQNPMKCEGCGDKENPIAKMVIDEWKIKCPDCWEIA
tara:strand:- start:424 stop:900 length:477 start_codon:yes stop_codon:yes gene_type:complete